MSNPEQDDIVQKGAEVIAENRSQVANQRRQILILQREARRQALNLKREESFTALDVGCEWQARNQ